MYYMYEQRFKDKELHLVLTSMREAYATIVSAVDDEHATGPGRQGADIGYCRYPLGSLIPTESVIQACVLAAASFQPLRSGRFVAEPFKGPPDSRS